MTRIHTIPVVYYHSVGPVISNWHRNFLTLNPERFRRHLDYLSRNYKIISLKELWHIRTGQSAPVRKPLVITFDDGYSDNFTWAFPMLKRYGIKATIFVVRPLLMTEISGERQTIFPDSCRGVR
jgi:peptidoglycan/xylan/chitin deacetylase (PgdA/CDA1 family)